MSTAKKSGIFKAITLKNRVEESTVRIRNILSETILEDFEFHTIFAPTLAR